VQEFETVSCPTLRSYEKVGEFPNPLVTCILLTPCYAKWFCLVVENFGAFLFLPLQLRFYELFILQLVQGGFCAVAQYFFRRRFLNSQFSWADLLSEPQLFLNVSWRILVNGFLKFLFVAFSKFNSQVFQRIFSQRFSEFYSFVTLEANSARSAQSSKVEPKKIF
jgi:hypothetical protein